MTAPFRNLSIPFLRRRKEALTLAPFILTSSTTLTSQDFP